jgi:hypothetical protein
MLDISKPIILKILKINSERKERCMKKICMLLLVLFFIGCTAQFSTLKEGNNFAIFNLDEDKIFRIVHREMLIFANDKVQDLRGEEKGYSTTFRMMLDRFDVKVKILPVAGPTLEGKEIRGYYVQLEGGGTYPAKKPEMMMESIRIQLEETNSKVIVTSIKRVPYSANL